MGLYDTVEIHESIDVPDEMGDVRTLQTKSLECLMDSYRVTEEGRLEREETETHLVPEEDRPHPDEDGLMKMAGMFNEESLGWKDTDYHGIVEVHESIGDEYRSFDLKFTDGELVDIEYKGERG